MNQSDCSGKTLKPWPVLLDHYTLPPLFENQDIVRHLLRSLMPYPELAIEWLPVDAHLNIIDEQIDIGIRIGTIPDNRFIVKVIRPVGIRIVAAPDLVKRLGMPDTIRTLQYTYPLSALSNSNSGRVWPWQFADGCSFFPAKPAFIARDIGSELAAALAGITCSQLPDITVRPYLQRGELVNLFPGMNFSPYQLYIFRPHQPLLPMRTRVVFDNLTKILHGLLVNNFFWYKAASRICSPPGWGTIKFHLKSAAQS